MAGPLVRRRVLGSGDGFTGCYSERVGGRWLGEDASGAMTGHALPQVAEALYAQAMRGITTMLPSTDAAWVDSVAAA